MLFTLVSNELQIWRPLIFFKSGFLAIKKLTIKNNEDTIYKHVHTLKPKKNTYLQLNKRAYKHKRQNDLTLSLYHASKLGMHIMS